MFVDVVELNFNNYGKLYHPGEELICHLVVNSAFNLNCKFVRIRIIAPYLNKKKEYFRCYEYAKIKRTSLRTNGTLKEEIGDEAQNFRLVKGRNRFVVKCEIPEVPEEAFKENKGVLRCGFKVTVKLNWLLKLNCLDWIVLEPLTVTEAVVDKIDAGLNFMVNSMNSFQKKVKSLTRSNDAKKEMHEINRDRKVRTLK